MKSGIIAFALIVVTLATQRLLGQPTAWPLAAALLLPMPWIIGPSLQGLDRRWYWLSFLVGFGWDLLFEPVIGIGTIAWSVPALIVWMGTSVIAERRTRAWFVFGTGATVVFWLVRFVCYLPLDLPGTPAWSWIGASALVTGLWCATVHGILKMDLPARWRHRRRRQLR